LEQARGTRKMRMRLAATKYFFIGKASIIEIIKYARIISLL